MQTLILVTQGTMKKVVQKEDLMERKSMVTVASMDTQQEIAKLNGQTMHSAKERKGCRISRRT